MNIPLLEDRLAANPKSPLFARLASCYLKEGEVQKAVDVCTRGLKDHPDYTTAHLVLARCFEAMGRNLEALVEYRRVLKSFPDNLPVITLVQNIERKEQEAFRSFAEERLQELRRKQGLTPRKVAEEPARPIRVEREDEEDEAEDEVRTTGGQKIVTATLAEIYASQGEFGEAIQIYKRLSIEKPGEAETYLKRIADLEDILKHQQTESDR